MNFWKVILATVVIFGAGVFTGGLLVNYVDHSHRPHHLPNEANSQSPENFEQESQQRLPSPPLAERLGKQWVQQLDDKLRLTSEQHEKIEKIVADGQEQNRSLWTNVAPKMRAVIQDVNRQILEELTPEQQNFFEALMKQQHMPHRPQNSTNASTIFSTNALISPATNQ